MSTYHVFVRWRKARSARERILADLATAFAAEIAYQYEFLTGRPLSVAAR